MLHMCADVHVVLLFVAPYLIPLRIHPERACACVCEKPLLPVRVQQQSFRYCKAKKKIMEEDTGM